MSLRERIAFRRLLREKVEEARLLNPSFSTDQIKEVVLLDLKSSFSEEDLAKFELDWDKLLKILEQIIKLLSLLALI